MMASAAEQAPMEGVASLTLKSQSRVVVPLVAQPSRHSFLTATASLRDPNELHLVDYNEDTGTAASRLVFPHKNEVWSLAPSPVDAGLVWTGHCEKGASAAGLATLWRMEGVEGDASSDDSDAEEGDDGDGADAAGGGAVGDATAAAPVSGSAGTLTEVVSLPEHSSKIHTILWSPRSKPSSADVLTMDATSVKLWAVSDGGRTAAPTREVSVDAAHRINSGAWDPHHPNEFVVACEASLLGYDTRTLEAARTMDNAHTQAVRSVSYNPNKPWYLASSGDDTLVKFWDVRKPDAPVKVLDGHTHWVWSVAYNPFHDQLVLSAGSDAETLLWRVSSISSAPLLEVDEDDGEPGAKSAVDALVSHVEGHEDSVYSVAWSACNAWTFASMSFNGRLTICCVPAAEKYKILL